MTKEKRSKPVALDAEEIAFKETYERKIKELQNRRKQLMAKITQHPSDNRRSKTKTKANTTAKISNQLREVDDEIRRYEALIRRLEGKRGGRKGQGKKGTRRSETSPDHNGDSERERKGPEIGKSKRRKRKRRKKKGGPWIHIWQGGAPQ